MKNLLTILMLFVGFNLSAQKEPKTKIVKFKTSAICEMCEERIEDALNYTKGVVYAELDLDTKVLEVKYKTKFLNAEKVKYAVSMAGYDAGETPRNQKAFDALPKCCQSEGHCHDN
jgi:copper chaperone CopZ